MHAGWILFAGLAGYVGIGGSAAAESGPTPRYAQKMADCAKTEFTTYLGKHDDDPALSDRIDQYFAAIRYPRSAHWSGAFVSYCVKQTDATGQQFGFSSGHWAYIQQAMKGIPGTFNACRIEDCPILLGDIVSRNRFDPANKNPKGPLNGEVTYDGAPQAGMFPSHSSIVVGFQAKDGVRYAEVILGAAGPPGANKCADDNARYSAGDEAIVGRQCFELTAAGTLKQLTSNPFIAVVRSPK